MKTHEIWRAIRHQIRKTLPAKLCWDLFYIVENRPPNTLSSIEFTATPPRNQYKHIIGLYCEDQLIDDTRIIVQPDQIRVLEAFKVAAIVQPDQIQFQEIQLYYALENKSNPKTTTVHIIDPANPQSFFDLDKFLQNPQQAFTLNDRIKQLRKIQEQESNLSSQEQQKTHKFFTQIFSPYLTSQGILNTVNAPSAVNNPHIAVQLKGRTLQIYFSQYQTPNRQHTIPKGWFNIIYKIPNKQDRNSRTFDTFSTTPSPMFNELAEFVKTRIKHYGIKPVNRRRSPATSS